MEPRIPIENTIEISAALNEILETYDVEIGQCVEDSVKETMKDMKAETKSTAPVDDGRWEQPNKYGKGFPNHRKNRNKTHGEFRRKISHKSTGKGFSYESMWYVKSPEYRLTHLLVHGHQKFIFGRNTGERVEGNMFLHNARDHAAESLPETLARKVSEASR